MQKIYLLLRNNKQTGPHSLDELVEAKLKSHDLIWVEGRSAGWRYPSEIDALKPFLPSVMVMQGEQISPAGHIEKMPEPTEQQVASPIGATLKSSARHIFVSLPSAIKQPEVLVEPTVQENSYQDAGIKSITSYPEIKNNYSQPVEEPISQTKYSKSLNEIEEDYTKWIFTKKKKQTLVSQQTLVFSVAGLILFAAVYIGISYFTNKKSESKSPETAKAETAKIIPSTTTNNVNTEVQTKPQLDNTTYKVPDIKTAVIQQQANSIPPTSTVVSINHQSNSSHAGKNLKQHKLNVKKERQKETVATILPKQNPIVSQQGSVTEKHEPVAEAKTTKKKGFGAFLNGVFGKLKKKNQEEQVPENHPTVQSMPSETRANGERRATRRDDNQQAENEIAEHQEYTPLPSLIELQGSERNNSWQLGVYDLKLTLINKNNVPLKSAGVNILYFDENNRLLETKTVYFNTIAPRGHSTIKVPDQKWADHTDYKLIALK